MTRVATAARTYIGWVILYAAWSYIIGVCLIWLLGYQDRLHSVEVRVVAGLTVVGFTHAISTATRKASEAFRA